MAVTLDAFAKYQNEAAWTWEHMALTRARVLVGSDSARTRLETIIADVLTQTRDPADLLEAVLEMRSEMAQHKPAKGLLDVKLMRGGLVDLEFAVHFLQLREGIALQPDLSKAVDELVAAGHLPSETREAHDLMTRALVAGRLLAPDLSEEPPKSAASALAKACQCETYSALLRRLGEARQIVAAIWQQTFELKLEIET